MSPLASNPPDGGSGESRGRLDVLTSLRFFAALLVFLSHYAAELTAKCPYWVRGLTQHGHSAVAFFFVLSGFILGYTYLDRQDASGLKGNAKSFWTARFSRVYPLYALALAIALFPYVYGAWRGRNGLTETVWGLLLVPLALQAWAPPIAIEWNVPAWSLSVEAFFYAVFPWLALRFKRSRPWHLLLGVLVLVCVSSFIRDWLLAASLHAPSATNLTLKNLALFFPLLHLPGFLVGMALGNLFLRSPAAPAAWAPLVFRCTLGALTVLFALRAVLPGFLYSQAVLVSLYAIVIYSGAQAARQGSRLLTHPFWVRLGDASYALYILQAPLSFWFVWLAEKGLHLADWKHNVGFFLFLLVAIVGLSILSYELVEKPCRRAIRQWLASLGQARPTVLAPTPR